MFVRPEIYTLCCVEVQIIDSSSFLLKHLPTVEDTKEFPTVSLTTTVLDHHMSRRENEVEVEAEENNNNDESNKIHGNSSEGQSKLKHKMKTVNGELPVEDEEGGVAGEIGVVRSSVADMVLSSGVEGNSLVPTGNFKICKGKNGEETE
ncbi:unnamed protein product [Sphenostylis stenocarpa]|uniref:Uncharacterized protein n=1 Tax=Sphenostylis stenocarpa TaxID=92480 RepID=A0AA86T4M9_9FABA|nr:unnamed protein product [Sphenostylis stenocarpa]